MFYYLYQGRERVGEIGVKGILGHRSFCVGGVDTGYGGTQIVTGLIK